MGVRPLRRVVEQQIRDKVTDFHLDHLDAKHLEADMEDGVWLFVKSLTQDFENKKKELAIGSFLCLDDSSKASSEIPCSRMSFAHSLAEKRLWSL